MSKQGGADRYIGRAWESIMGPRRVVAVTQMGASRVALVQTGDRRTGHDIVALDQLDSEIAFESKQLRSRLAHSPPESPPEAPPLGAFGETLSPRMRGIARRALCTKGVISDGAFYASIADLVRSRVADGWRVVHTAGGRRFVGPRGQFLTRDDVLKLGMDYAAFLSREAT